MHAGLFSLWLTGAFLFPQCFGDPDDSDYEEETATAGYSNYTEYADYEYDNTTSIDYYLYETLAKGIDQEQSKSIKDGAVNNGVKHVNDKASAVFSYFAVGVGLTVQQFCR